MVKMTSFLIALLTRVLCESLVSVNVYNKLMEEGDGERNDDSTLSPIYSKLRCESELNP